jgi:hypothetical protein
MRALKLICLFFCALSVISIIQGVRVLESATAGTTSMKHGVVGTALSLVDAVFWAFAFYGIQKKIPMAWKLGWAVIVVGLVEFLILALSSIIKLPASSHPLFASAAVVVGGSAIALYWSFWWNRQRNYFVPGATSADRLR